MGIPRKSGSYPEGEAFSEESCVLVVILVAAFIDSNGCTVCHADALTVGPATGFS